MTPLTGSDGPWENTFPTMGISEWAVLLRTDADAVYWAERVAEGPRVHAFAVMRFVNATPSMHAFKVMPSGHYLLFVSEAPRSECLRWFEAAVRPGDVFTKPGGTYRPDGWDECADYAWVCLPPDDATLPSNVISRDAEWQIPPAPPAEWMVHLETPDQLAATLAAIAGFNAEHGAAEPALRLEVTRVVRQISGTKRLPPGLWLVTVNADAGDRTARWWKGEFQIKGRAIAADPQSCHTVRRAKAVIWSAAAATAPVAGTDGTNTVVTVPPLPTLAIFDQPLPPPRRTAKRKRATAEAGAANQ